MERAIIDSRTTGFLKLTAGRRRSLLLGAHAAGENAVEVIQAVTTAMAAAHPRLVIILRPRRGRRGRPG